MEKGKKGGRGGNSENLTYRRKWRSLKYDFSTHKKKKVSKDFFTSCSPFNPHAKIQQGQQSVQQTLHPLDSTQQGQQQQEVSFRCQKETDHQV
jgi:hypothetical protein